MGLHIYCNICMYLNGLKWITRPLGQPFCVIISAELFVRSVIFLQVRFQQSRQTDNEAKAVWCDMPALADEKIPEIRKLTRAGITLEIFGVESFKATHVWLPLHRQLRLISDSSGCDRRLKHL